MIFDRLARIETTETRDDQIDIIKFKQTISDVNLRLSQRKSCEAKETLDAIKKTIKLINPRIQFLVMSSSKILKRT